MKKNNLFKILLIVFVFCVFLSWIIPAGVYDNAIFTNSGLKPAGLFDLTLAPLTVFDLALPSILLILIVGGFYGVINKTGVYQNLVSSMVKKLKGKEVKFLIIITISLCLFSSLVGLNIAFFVIIPFISAILLSLGFSNVTVMISTVGSIITGMIGSIYGNDVSYYINSYLGFNNDLNYNTELYSKIILMVIIAFLLIMYLSKRAKMEINQNNRKNEEKKDILLLDNDIKTKRSYMPLFVLILMTFLFILVGSFKWDSVIGMSSGNKPFFDFYQRIMEIKIGDFAIFEKILGTFPAIGYWELPFISVFTLFMTIIIGLVYKVKIDDMVSGFTNGVQKIFKISLYLIGANLVFALLFRNGSNENFVVTFIDYFMNIPQNFSSIVISLTTLITSLFFNNFSTLISNIYFSTVILTGSIVNLRFLASIIMQTMYGLVMFIAPTSVLLITGLSYFNISYKEWFKNIWKLLLQFVIVIILVIIILTVFAR